MNKHKLVGIINLLFGVLIFLLALIFSIFVIPKLNSLYSEFNASTSSNINTSYLGVLVMLATSITNIFLGIKGFSNTKKKNAYYKYGLISVIVTSLFSGAMIGFMLLSSIQPIYNLISQF